MEPTQHSSEHIQPTQSTKLRLEYATLTKKQSSCLFLANMNKKEKKLSEIFMSTSSLLETKREPLAARPISNAQNMM